MKERAASKQKLEKELKKKESKMIHMQEQHEKEVEKWHMKVKDKEEEVEKVCCNIPIASVCTHIQCICIYIFLYYYCMLNTTT